MGALRGVDLVCETSPYWQVYVDLRFWALGERRLTECHFAKRCHVWLLGRLEPFRALSGRSKGAL